MIVKLLKTGLWLLGLAAIGVGGGILVLGGASVFEFCRGLINVFTQTEAIPEIATPNMDSEFRFYGTMFAFYGGVVIQTVRSFDKYFGRIPILLSVFFIAGLGRVASFVMVGTPHLLFIVLGAIEIILPLVLFMLWRAELKRAV